MKVLQINAVCGTGSTGKICQDLYWELKKQGHDCKIAWGRKKLGTVPDCDTIQIGTPLDYCLHALSTRIFDNTGFCSKRATKIFIKKVIAYNPDVIHLHNLHGYYINIDILFNYLRTCGKKIIWTLHDCWSFTGHCAHMDYIGCRKWETQCFCCPQKKEYPRSDIFDRSYINYCRKKELFTNIPNLHIVTPSKWLAGLVTKSFLKDYPVSVIYNGVNTTQFKPSPSNLREYYHLEGKKIILAVANQWTDRKGYKDILKLAKELPVEEYQVVMIGLSKKQIREVPNTILGLGRIESGGGLAKWYSIADAFVNTTYEEVFGMVNIEAQLCGALVISYGSGGTIETEIYNNCCKFVEKGEWKEIVKILLNYEFNKKTKSIYIYDENRFKLNYIELYNA